ncbi:MAG: hypothetical protein JWN77_2882, partial [Frankiales bacterium]|nr:hypothetical protein [Frankiales bacterium]
MRILVPLLLVPLLAACGGSSTPAAVRSVAPVASPPAASPSAAA